MHNGMLTSGVGMKDSAAKQYFGKREVFADLCNAYIFIIVSINAVLKKLWDICVEN